MQNIFGEEQTDIASSKFKINKDFAKKFEHRKEREHLEQAKQKYGENLEDLDESSTSESEDDNGVLVNNKISNNFLLAIAKIRAKVPSVYNLNEKLFTENDFDEEIEQNKKEKAITYKDMVRQEMLDKMNDSEQDDKIKRKKIQDETPVEEEKRLKEEFKLAGKINEKDEDIFTLKKKNKKQKQLENNDFQKFLKNQHKEDAKVLESFWGNKNDENQDETDKFLKNYILNQGWIDKDDDFQINDDFEEQDEEREEQNDQFEMSYNFRFEEPGANQIQTFSRDIVNSVRNIEKDGGRKKQRESKKLRQQEEKIQMQEEIKQLKNIKKSEILSRVAKIRNISQNSKIIDTKDTEDFIDEEYDPDKFDQQMNKLFDEQYYESEDENSDDIKEKMQQEDEISIDGEIKEVIQLPDENKNKNEDKDNVLQAKANIPVGRKKNMNKEEVKLLNETGDHIFWYCDHCKKGIKALQPYFDCQQLNDYTLCKVCHELKLHPDYKFKKSFVPDGCSPPSDDEVEQILQKFKNCKNCQIKLNDYNSYYALQSNKDNVMCEECLGEQPHKIRKHYQYIEALEVDLEALAKDDPSKLKQATKDDELNKLVDEYYGLDFEDVIAGGLKTKFKYINCEAEDYGLNDDTIFYSDDKILNSYVGVKKLAPYRDDNGHIKESVLSKRRPLIEKNAKLNKKIIKNQLKLIQKTEEEIQALKQKKTKNKEKFHQLVTKVKKLQENATKSTGSDKKSKSKVTIEDLSHMDPYNQTDMQEYEKSKKKKKVNQERLNSYGLE